jgi:hypothetical protein
MGSRLEGAAYESTRVVCHGLQAGINEEKPSHIGCCYCQDYHNRLTTASEVKPAALPTKLPFLLTHSPCRKGSCSSIAHNDAFASHADLLQLNKPLPAGVATVNDEISTSGVRASIADKVHISTLQLLRLAITA